MPGNRLGLLNNTGNGPGLLVGTDLLSAMVSENALTTFDVAGTHPSIFGNLQALSGIYSLEMIFYSTSQVSLANRISFGVARPGTSPLKYCGEESTSVGWRVGDGRIDSNGAALVSGLVLPPERTVLGMYLVLTPTGGTLSFTLQGTAISAAIALPGGFPWLPMFSMSGDTAADLRFQVNFGQYLFETPLDVTGWNEQTPGLSTQYLSLLVEAFMSAGTDSPPNQHFDPRVMNGPDFSIARAPLAWPHRADESHASDSVSPVPAAYAPLILRDNDGKLSALQFADPRDSVVTLDQIEAPAMAQGNIATSATRMFTANIDSVSKPGAGQLQVNLRDNIARIDGDMRMHLIPGFFDSNVAGSFVPFGVGAQRNFNPPQIDGSLLIFLLGDSNFTAVPLVMDNAAPLDPLSPQYVAAPYLGRAGCAIQLNQPYVGKVSCDASTAGTYTPTGVRDILGGIGDFSTWTAGVPNGFAKPTNPPYPALVVSNGSLTHVTTNPLFPHICRITSSVPYVPGAGVGFYYGWPLAVSSIFFQVGKTYRVQFTVAEAAGDYRQKFGLWIGAGAVDDPRFWVSDFHLPINSTGVYAYEFTCPSAGAGVTQIAINLWVVSAFGAPVPSAAAAYVGIAKLTIEELGTYQNQPLKGSTIADAFTKVLVDHQGEPASLFSSSDCAVIQATTVTTDYPDGYVWGLRAVEPPHVPSTLQEILDVFCAGMFTDAFNQIRVGRLIAPEDGTPVALLEESDLYYKDDTDFIIFGDDARGLTTSFAGGRNWDPNGENDFVTDTALVTADRRQQLMTLSQFYLDVACDLASEYAHARSAPRYHTLFDNPVQLRAEMTRVLAIWSRRLIGGQVKSGKRNIVTFSLKYTGLLVGSGPSIAPQNLFPFHCVTLNFPKRGIASLPGIVLSTQLFPFVRRLKLEVLV